MFDQVAVRAQRNLLRKTVPPGTLAAECRSSRYIPGQPPGASADEIVNVHIHRHNKKAGASISSKEQTTPLIEEICLLKI